MADKIMIAVDNPEPIIKSLQQLLKDCEKLMLLLQASEVTEIIIKEPGE